MLLRLGRGRFLGLLALVAGLGVVVVQAQDCSASNPCETGCCSKFGFCGLGPDYCKPGTCVANCDRKADCDPGGYGPDYVKSTTCPLNVCCSKWGFCGFTSEFCSPKDAIMRPSCSTVVPTAFSRVVGYYEGWSPSRPCNKFYPEQLPVGVYTHLNFAFASIDPVTFHVVPASSYDTDLYKRLTNLKLKDPSLKVFIAIGGWTFNDDGPTATTFSDLAASADAQKAFIKSLLSFMSTYNFDGVDLDWEYPEAPDRHGRGVDFVNFPTFLENLKKSLSASGGRDGLSVTLPASYWYLQHFDIKKLARTVDFFNLMTYDFHGVWDKPETPSKWVVPLLNAHTNLTEIKGAMDLLWRNGISPDKVTMGMAFYGRAFTAASPACMTPGCTFASGAQAQKCSSEVGIILNSEIDQLVSARGLTPTLDRDAAVKIITWDGDQWVAYDDEDTFALKAKFAQSQCLGGLMVWAISHDTHDAKYSQLLGTVANRRFQATMLSGETGGDGGNATGSDGYEYVAEYKQQCRWTGCNENCPSGWIRMLRKDGGAKGEEYMVDEAGCDGYGQHQLCCPPDQALPTCGWYNHNNGNCDNACPAGTREVGSNYKYCGKKSAGGYAYQSYQAACCTTATDNTKLWGQCNWTTWPYCYNDASCPAGQETVAASGTGSGDAQCFGWPNPASTRKYCCNNGDENSRWSSCEWHSDLNQGSALHPADFCHANCPQDTVRVAMDHTGCSGGSAKARCCTPDIKSVSKRQTSQDAENEYYLSLFLENPVCSAANIFEHGSLNWRDITTLAMEQAGITMLTTLFWAKPTTSQTDLWNRRIAQVSRFASLSYANLHDYLVSTAGDFIRYTLGSSQGPRYILCNLDLIAGTVSNWLAEKAGHSGNSSTISCACVRTDCCAEDDAECIAFDPDAPLARRAELPTSPAALARAAPTLERRDGTHIYKIWLPDYSVNPPVMVLYEWTAPGYPSTGELQTPRDDAIFDETWDFNPNCPQFRPRSFSLNPAGSRAGYQVEHPFDRNRLAAWSHGAVAGVLADDTTPYLGNRVPLNFFTVTLMLDARGQVGAAAGGFVFTTWQSRIMNAMGTTPNRRILSLAASTLNNLKRMMWLLNESYISRRRMENLVLGTGSIAPNPVEALRELRNVVATFQFHNEQSIHDNLGDVITTIRQEIRYAERQHLGNFGVTVYVLDHFDAWMQDHFERMRVNVRNFVLDWTDELTSANRNNAQIVAVVVQMEATVRTMSIDQTGFYPVLP